MDLNSVEPLVKLKKVWNYCTYNKPFFILVLILFVILNFLQDYYEPDKMGIVYLVFFNIFISGYWMTVTRDRISGGVRLPKILVKDVLNLGIKSTIVSAVYATVQGFVLDFVSSPMNFPEFDLEEMLLDFPETINTLISHNPVDAAYFIILGAIIFYVTTFFMEIALARLADTGSIVAAFNLPEIKKDIDILGWKNYVKEYTAIILAIVLIAYFQYITLTDVYLNYIWGLLLDLFIYATQFLGIGAVYAQIKERKLQLAEEDHLILND